MLLLVDANVLIDYLQSDFTIMYTVANHLGDVYVLRDVFNEVKGLTERDCERVGISIIEPEFEQFVAAGEQRGTLSFEDHLCLIVAQGKGWTCITNDRPLRRACEEEGVDTRWGLQLMLELVAQGNLLPDDAIAVVRTIQEQNPRHVTDAIVDDFILKARGIQG